MGGHDRRQQPPLVANRAATVVLQRWLPSGVGSARSLSGSWGCARPSQPAKESEDDASSIHFHRPSLSTRSRLSTPSDCTIPWTAQINFREMHNEVAPIRSGNKWKRSWVGPFRTRPFATSLWPADAPTETPPSRTRTPPAGVHPLGRDAVCSAVLDRRVPSRGSRRQPPASRGNAIPLSRCLLRSQVLPTRNTPRPHPCPVGRPLVGGRSGHGGGGGKGKREEHPAPLRAAAAAASGRGSGGRTRRTGSRSPHRDGGLGRGAGGSRARGTAAQRLGGGADGSGGPGAWRSAKGQGGGRVRRRAQHVRRAAKGGAARGTRGAVRGDPSLFTPAGAARPSAAPSADHRGGRCRPSRAAAELGGRWGIRPCPPHGGVARAPEGVGGADEPPPFPLTPPPPAAAGRGAA